MALAALKTWVSGEVLTASDLNAMNANILDNSLSLISPLTGTLNANSNQITNLVLQRLSVAPTAATEGRVWYNTTRDQVEADDGTNIRRVPTMASLLAGSLIYATDASTYAVLGVGSEGQSLTVTGGLPVWGAGGANILQVQVFS